MKRACNVCAAHRGAAVLTLGVILSFGGLARAEGWDYYGNWGGPGRRAVEIATSHRSPRGPRAISPRGFGPFARHFVLPHTVRCRPHLAIVSRDRP